MKDLYILPSSIVKGLNYRSNDDPQWSWQNGFKIYVFFNSTDRYKCFDKGKDDQVCRPLIKAPQLPGKLLTCVMGCKRKTTGARRCIDYECVATPDELRFTIILPITHPLDLFFFPKPLSLVFFLVWEKISEASKFKVVVKARKLYSCDDWLELRYVLQMFCSWISFY